MKLTRRHLLGTGALALSGMALEGCHKDEALRPADVKDFNTRYIKGNPLIYDVDLTVRSGRLLTTFEGLCAMVLSSKGNGVDLALLATEPLGPFGHDVMPHTPTLVVNRRAIQMGTTALASSVDTVHASYSLEGKDLFIEPVGLTAAAEELKINSSPLVRGEECPSPRVEDFEHWNNLNWVLDFASEVHPGALKANWREQPVVTSIVHLQTGVIEAKELAMGEKGGKEDLDTLRRWKLRDGSSRGLKERVRHTMIAPSYRLTFVARSDGSRSVLLVQGKADIGILQLPAFFMGDVDKLTDLLACYLLMEDGEKALEKGSVPFVPEKDGGCDPSSSGTCGCCPTSRFVDPNW